MREQVEGKQAAELKRIVGVLVIRRNDPAALQDFTRLVKSMKPAARQDLVTVLQEMISDAQKGGAL